MKVENCLKCGGMHWGQYVCPFTDEQIARMGIPRRLDNGDITQRAVERDGNAITGLPAAQISSAKKNRPARS
jgi:hypothetical protein